MHCRFLCLAASAALGLAGCVTHTWAPGPGMSAADFGPATARCRLVARHGGSDFMAYGNAKEIAAAELGNAIGESIRANRDFNDCMEASGWRIADQAAALLENPQFLELVAKRNACVQAARDEPEYAPLAAHFSDLATGRFSMQQLADGNRPTAQEGRLMARYADEVAPCVDSFIAGVGRLAPSAGGALLGLRRQLREILLSIAARRVTWGEAARRQRRLQRSAAAEIR